MFSSDTTQVSDGGYQISRSLRFNSADSTNVQRTFSTTGTSQTTSTLSMWFKRGDISRNQRIFDCYDGSSGSSTGIFLDNDYITLDYGRGSGAKLVTTQVLRDVSAWYHLVAVFDSSNATSSNRIKLYLNGSQITTFSTAIYPSQNALNNWMSANSNNRVGSSWDGSANFSGYITEVNFIDGQALTPSYFGETNAQTGVWQPKAYSGSYGTNGFYLNFSDNSNTTAATLGKDYSGNGNNWTPNGFLVSAGVNNDSLVDSPTSYGTDTGVGGTVRGNYATLNPLLAITTSGVTNPTLANGNLSFVGNLSTDTSGRSTIGMTSGTWYAEITISYVSAIQDGVGIAYTQSDSSRSFGVLYRTNGNKLIDNTASAYGSSYAAGDVIGIAVDATNNQVTFYKNGTSQGAISFTPTTAIYFSTYGTNASPAFAGDINFGQRPFSYTAPSGYKALCTQNLPTPTIGATTATQAGKYFNTVLWSGDDTNPRTITGVGFQPDWVWVKGRNAAVNHFLQDAVRGVTSSDTRSLVTNSSDAETNYYAGSGGVTAFASDGFTTSGGSSNGNLNLSGRTFVAWNWKANGSGSTNTAGSITSTVSANTTSGFSIVTYTGTGSNATVGHGLGVAPSFIIVKRRDAGSSWNCYQANLGASQYIQIDGTAGAATNTGVWNNTAPTTSVFSIGTAFAGVNASGSTHVAYCFAEVAGYSKFGSYTGNGSTDGTFVFTGFRPRYIMAKSSSNTNSWIIFDSARDTYNVMGQALYANLSDAEYSISPRVDFLSNGFKLRSTGEPNNSGYTFIYMAFAETPLKFSLAR